jgi:hypothetical protein
MKNELNRVEILKANVLINGRDEYSVAQLKQIADAYDMDKHSAPVIWSHANDNWSEPIKAASVLANGWVTKLYVEEASLYCDCKVDDATYNALKEETLSTRSVGLYTDASLNHPTGSGFYLRHLALLGSEPPAVKGLEAIKIYNDTDITMDESQEAINFLNEKTADWLAYALNDEGNGFNGGIVEIIPQPSQDNNWLYDAETESYSGQFKSEDDLIFDFSITKEDDNWVISTTMSQESQDSLPEEDEEAAVESVIEASESEEVAVEESEEVAKMKAYMEQMQAELAKYKEAAEKAMQEKAVAYCDMMYENGYVSEDSVPREKVARVFDAISRLGESLMYSDGDKNVSILDTVVDILKASGQVKKQYSDAVAGRNITPMATSVNKPRYASGTEDSEKAYNEVKQFMKDNNIADFKQGWAAFKAVNK